MALRKSPAHPLIGDHFSVQHPKCKLCTLCSHVDSIRPVLRGPSSRARLFLTVFYRTWRSTANLSKAASGRLQKPLHIRPWSPPPSPTTNRSHVLGISRLSSILLLAACASAYTWPNPQLDELESLLYDQHGFNERGILAGALTPCNAFGFGSTVNRSNAADWIRTVRLTSRCCLHIRRLMWTGCRPTTIWLRTTWKTAPADLMLRSSLSRTGRR